MAKYKKVTKVTAAPGKTREMQTRVSEKKPARSGSKRVKGSSKKVY